MAGLNTERDPLDVLAEEFAERLRCGERPSVSEYVDRYPDRAAEIRELLPSVAAMEQLKQRSSQPAESLPEEQAPERLGDFHLLREIGRGGMGIVYEAEQESLGRRVAIKVLPRQFLLDDNRLKRFEREARAAAALHHTNIVPVFGVGEDDGFHYYVMQLIHGVGLDALLPRLRKTLTGDKAASVETGHEAGRNTQAVTDVLRTLLAGGFAQPRVSGSGSGGSAAPRQSGQVDRASDTDSRAAAATTEIVSERRGDGTGLPADATDEAECSKAGTGDPQSATIDHEPGCAGRRYWQTVARIGLQAADALQYAHAQGTLHRDVKPANLLLDAQGIVWVADFGLAKAAEHEGISRTGDIVGTLRYMAPEQLDGHADARSDIYSLGLTLYELLTFRSAYGDSDRKRTLLNQAAYQEPPRPRKLNAMVPRDLETIVLKAMTHEPAHRYQTAGELAADLQRFLDDRPIRARRVSPVEKLRRWCRRNPLTAASSGTALVLLLVTLSVTSIAWIETNDALQRESRQRERAETTLGISLEALERVYERLAPDRVATEPELTVEGVDGEEVEVPVQPAVSRETAALLQELLAFYDRLAEQTGDKDMLREQTARAQRRIGDIHKRLGRFEQAEAAYRQAIDAYGILAADAADGATWKLETARIHNKLGGVYRMLDKDDEARAAHQEALRIVEPMASASTSRPEVRYELARTCYHLGSRRNAGFRERRTDSRDNRREAEYLERAISLLETLVKKYPSVPSYQHLLAICHRDGSRRWSFRRRERADTCFAKAVSILERLTEEYPDVPDYRHDLAKTYAMVPRRHNDRHRDNDDRRDNDHHGENDRHRDDENRPDIRTMEKRLQKALELSEELVRDYPNVPEYTVSLAHIHGQLGRRLSGWVKHASPDPETRDRLLEKAETHFREALKLQMSLAERQPDDLSDRPKKHISWLQHGLTEVLRERGRFTEARELLEAKIAKLKTLLKNDPRDRFVRYLLHDAKEDLAEVLRETGRPAEARELLEPLIEKLNRLLQDDPRNRFVRGQLYRANEELAETLRDLGEEQRAAEAAQRAEELRDSLRRRRRYSRDRRDQKRRRSAGEAG